MSALLVGIVIAFFARMLVVACNTPSHWIWIETRALDIAPARVVGELPPARASAEILPCCAWSLGEGCSKCCPSWRVEGLAPVYRDGRLVEPTAIPGPGVVRLPVAGPGIPCKH